MFADYVIYNARIYTVDPDTPWAESVAILDDKFIGVGTDHDISNLIGPDTVTLDLNGRFVLPGFSDAHLHFAKGSRNLAGVLFRNARTFAEVLDRIKRYVADTPDAPWILGAELGIDYPDLTGGFHKSYLDDINSDRPFFLRSGMGHADWVNSKTLELAGITRDTPDPVNGTIMRDNNGEPTGWLVEEARRIVEPHVPAMNDAETLACLRAGICKANRLGITAAQSAGHDDAILPMFEQLRDADELGVRLSIAQIVHPPSLTDTRMAEIIKTRERYHGPFLSVDSVKFFLDGVIESHTGMMPDGYADRPAVTGLQRWQDDALFAAFHTAHQHGFQNWCHATGQGSVTQALNGFATDTDNTHQLRPRIEHAEVPTANDIQRFAALGVVLGAQPSMIYPKDQCPGIEGIWQTRVGPNGMDRAFPLRSILDAGGAVAFGTDWPITDLNPLVGIRNAILRQSLDREPAGGWAAGQAISVAEAIYAYTLGAAFGGRRDACEGSIKSGKFADMIVLSDDLLTIEPHDIAEVEVLMTIVGGRIMYRSDPL